MKRKIYVGVLRMVIDEFLNERLFGEGLLEGVYVP